MERERERERYIYTGLYRARVIGVAWCFLLGLYGDIGYRDNRKENGNYYNIMGYI